MLSLKLMSRILSKPVLTENQFDRLSNILDNAGQVVFGVVVLSPLISNLVSFNWIMIILGIIIAVTCWSLSMILAGRGN